MAELLDSVMTIVWAYRIRHPLCSKITCLTPKIYFTLALYNSIVNQSVMLHFKYLCL